LGQYPVETNANSDTLHITTVSLLGCEVRGMRILHLKVEAFFFPEEGCWQQIYWRHK